MSSYFLDFFFGYVKSGLLRGIGYLLLTYSQFCTTAEKYSKITLVTPCVIQNKPI